MVNYNLINNTYVSSEIVKYGYKPHNSGYANILC